MKHLLPVLPALWLACAATAQPRVPMLPPAPPETTAPVAPAPVHTLGLAGPLQVRAGATPAPGPAQQARIEELVQEVFAAQPGLVLLTPVPPGAETVPEGYAVNLANDMPEADTQVRLALEAVRDQGRYMQETIPVQVELIDGEGLSLGGRMLDYRPAAEEGFRGELAAFLEERLETAPAAVSDPTAPALELWLGEEEGGRHVVYFRSGAEGYLSLYLQAPEQPLQRLFPSGQLPINRIQPGLIYRYPPGGGLPSVGGEIRAVLTVPPSNSDRPGAAGESLRIIPTQEPVLFADRDLSVIFSLPGYLYNEARVALPQGEGEQP